MTSTMFMHAALRCHKDTLSTNFGQWQYNILYGSTDRSLICSMAYNLLGKFEPYMFWIQGCRRLDLKPLNGIQGVKEGLIWALERFIQQKLGWL